LLNFKLDFASFLIFIKFVAKIGLLFEFLSNKRNRSQIHCFFTFATKTKW